MMARLDEIKETAPVRANKSKGLRSQKDRQSGALCSHTKALR